MVYWLVAFGGHFLQEIAFGDEVPGCCLEFGSARSWEVKR